MVNVIRVAKLAKKISNVLDVETKELFEFEQKEA